MTSIMRRAAMPNPHVFGPYKSASQAKLDELMVSSSSAGQTETADLATALKNKAKTKKALSPSEKAAYDKKMLAAMQDDSLQRLSDANKRATAAVVPGALGMLQPSGAGLAKAISTATDSQMASMDLQNVMQKQQQTMQMMSNIMKAQHDTASAIIRNIR